MVPVRRTTDSSGGGGGGGYYGGGGGGCGGSGGGGGGAGSSYYDALLTSGAKVESGKGEPQEVVITYTAPVVRHRLDPPGLRDPQGRPEPPG